MTGIAEDSLALDAAVDAVIEACGGDARSAVRALIVANNYLEAEAKRLAEAVSSGFTRGVKATCPKDHHTKRWDDIDSRFPHFVDLWPPEGGIPEAAEDQIARFLEPLTGRYDLIVDLRHDDLLMRYCFALEEDAAAFRAAFVGPAVRSHLKNASLAMCGRVRLPNDYSEIKIRLRFDATAPAPNLAPSWNTPPTGDMLVATHSADGRRISEVMRWGLIPRWAKDIKAGYSTFNARADSVAEKPAFRDAWKRGQRCLVVTDGFYEWRKKDRQPFAIAMADGDLMVMAGLWDEWVSPAGERIKSCTVITCEPNGVVGMLHDRMPVILEEKDWPQWFGEQPATEQELKALLVPCGDERLRIWPVHKRVGNVRNNSRDLAEPVIEQDLLL